MNYLLKHGLLCMCLLWCPILMAQTTFSMNETIQAPQTQDFVRYGNTPVSLYTGSMSVSIPIYTYKDTDFEIPIGLEYSSNGLIANKQTGIVGLGWHLNAGGVITRTVVGVPDETASTLNAPMNGYYSYHEFISVDENLPILSRGTQMYIDRNVFDEPFVYLAKPSDPYSSKYESTPDIFHFNFMGYEGTFQFDVNKKICIYNTNSSKYDFKIKALNFRNRLLSSFEITTNDGYKYIFGGDLGLYYDRECSIHENQLDRTVISWQLTKIITPNGRTVSFIYRSGDYESRGVVKSWVPSSDYLGVSNSQGGIFTNYEFKEMSVFPTYLEKIRIDDVCQIQLDYSAKEPERYGTIRDPKNFPGLLKLSSVDVKSLSPITKPILHCDLNYQYASSGNKVLFLNKVDFGGGKIYSMKYKDLVNNALPLHGTCALDHWGYYNGNSLITLNNFIPSTTTQKEKEIITSNEREANAFYSQIGMLEQISYPTGGYTKYEYEGNSYSRRAMDTYMIRYVPPTKTAGGVRVKSIADYTETGECNRREFTYEHPDKSSSGVLYKMPRYRLNYTMMISGTSYVVNRGSAQSMATYSLDEYHMEYAKVTEKRSDGATIEYNYNNSMDFYFNDQPQTPEYDEGIYIPNQRITSSNSRIVPFLLSKLQSQACRRGTLASLYTSFNGDTIYSEEYSYTNPGSRFKTVGGMNVEINYDYDVSNMRTAGDIFYIDKTRTVDKPQVWLKSTTEYKDGKVYTTIKRYDFRSKGYSSKVTSIETTMNNGDILKERIQYLQDDVPNLSSVEKMMLDSSLTRIPLRIVRTLKRNRVETLIEGQYNIFKKYGNLIKLEETRKKIFTDQPIWSDFNLNYGVDSDFHNDAYDSRGNLTQQTGKDGSVTSYVWGYNYRYPVATVKNASLKEVESVIGNTESVSSAKVPDEKILSLKNIHGALVEQYRYIPLMGISDITDTRGVNTYYEYDTEGRLKCVKDHDKNVISQYDYHYGATINQ